MNENIYTCSIGRECRGTVGQKRREEEEADTQVGVRTLGVHEGVHVCTETSPSLPKCTHA